MPLFAALPMGALILDHQQRIISVNQAFLALLGYADTQVLGRSLADLAHNVNTQLLADLLNSPQQHDVRLELHFVNAKVKTGPVSVVFSRCFEGTKSLPRLLSIILEPAWRDDTNPLLDRYADIVSASPDWIAFVDRGGRIKAMNEAFLKAIECSHEEILERDFKDIGNDDPVTAVLDRYLRDCLDTGQVHVEEIRETALDGASRGAEVRLFPHRDAAGRVTGVVVNIRDATSLRDTERRLLQSAAVYAATAEGVLITDAAGYIVASNPAFTRITGYRESELLGRKPNLLNSHWHPQSYFIGMWRLLTRRGTWQGEIWNRRKDGEIYLQKLTIQRVQDAHGKVINFVGVFADCNHAPQRRADYLIHYDALTKLPNRLLFESRLEHAIELGRGKAMPLALMLFDLDHFSHVNSSLGHRIGDALLRAVARRLRIAVRSTDTLARLRADQFGLICEDIDRSEEIEEIARRLQATLCADLDVCNHRISVTACIGVAFDTGMNNDRNALLAHAESALRLAKRQGRNGVRISPPEHDNAVPEHQRLIERLRNGLIKGEYRLAYRPRANLESGLYVGVEVLLRWDQQEIGPVPPERFLPLADECGFMAELGQWALATACRQVQNWLEHGLTIGVFSVPVSEAQLTRGHLNQTLERLLAENPLVGSRLDLAFNESLLQKHPEQIAEVFEGLRRLGVSITLNEVGAGWISPLALQRLPIKTLRIHPNFIESLPDSRDDLAVVQALIAMAQALDLEILADGVRTDEQRQLLLTIGCQQAQGALFGEPLFRPHFEHEPAFKPFARVPRALEN
ncbi:EAL domain-containing protein [uncultured Thiocystis sp.]|jgi:diguanylate cyclase (GGDEF)-like protein/PAS domain S-box-containing protein|uniref:EAL domain-containing protein n=1 Tax=uncultured Thiocystis sp. TaxID=1202134 RepID=UPI0025D5369F|nr:EAL domain-containing protein [uncultured Thiocystis sp.]